MNEEMQQWLQEYEEDILIMDGMDKALIGITKPMNSPAIAVYDWELIIEELMANGIESYEDAVEYADFNILGAYVGPQTPIVINRPPWVSLDT